MTPRKGTCPLCCRVLSLVVSACTAAPVAILSKAARRRTSPRTGLVLNLGSSRNRSAVRAFTDESR